MTLVTSFLLLQSCASAAPSKCVESLYKFGLDFDFSKLAPKAKVKTKTWKTPNPHVPREMIHWTTLTYNDSSVTTLECASCPPPKMVSELVLSTKRPLPCGLKNGMKEADIIQRLGAPSAKGVDYLVYAYPPEEEIQHITLQLREGHLNSIKWSFYVD